MIKYIKSRPRLAMSTALGCGLWLLLPPQLRLATRLLTAWDVSLVVYLALIFVMMLGSDHHTIRKRAATQDEGGTVILILTIVTALASLAAIVAELGNAKEVAGLLRGGHIALAGLTVFLSWTFLQTIFALHYAHEFYGGGDDNIIGGLEFPAHFRTPDYWDFVYYSFVIGTAAATADINITSPTIRKITTVHCMLVFFFNTTILALTVNIGAGLF